MKKIRSLILFVALLYALKAQAQVSGYQGMRFMPGYTFTPLINYSSTGGSNKSIYIYPVHDINLKYVLTRKVVVGAGFEMGNFKKILSPNDYGRPFTPSGDASMKTIELEIRRNSGDNTVAPLGNYLGLKLMYGFFNTKQYVANGNGYLIDTSLWNRNLRSFGMAISFGRTKVLFNRVVLDLGGQVGTYFKSWVILKFHDPTKPEQLAWTNGLGSFMFTNSLVTFRIGVSGLLF